MITDKVSITNKPPKIINNNSVFVKIPRPAKTPPKAREPVSPINILAGWLKNILIAVMFTEDEEEQEEIYNIIVEKAEKNLVAIIPNRTNIRKPYTSRRNKYKINLRNNM